MPNGFLGPLPETHGETEPWKADTGVAFVFCGRTLESLRVPNGRTRAWGHLQSSLSNVAGARVGTHPSKDLAEARWSSLVSTTVIKAMDKSNSGKKGSLCLAYASSPSPGDERHELRNAPYWTAPPGLLSYTTQAHLPKVAPPLWTELSLISH